MPQDVVVLPRREEIGMGLVAPKSACVVARRAPDRSMRIATDERLDSFRVGRRGARLAVDAVFAVTAEVAVGAQPGIADRPGGSIRTAWRPQGGRGTGLAPPVPAVIGRNAACNPLRDEVKRAAGWVMPPMSA
ncbi:hypothetical protein Ddc_23904 [Ditylenchus destructor]|nr:hypothetical protein Ddc_23904 [Ditylenchus destructor]